MVREKEKKVNLIYSQSIRMSLIGPLIFLINLPSAVNRKVQGSFKPFPYLFLTGFRKRQLCSHWFHWLLKSKALFLSTF